MKISEELHFDIPEMVRLIVKANLEQNEPLYKSPQHSRECLDEIIADLQQYASEIPSVKDLEVCQVL